MGVFEWIFSERIRLMEKQLDNLGKAVEIYSGMNRVLEDQLAKVNEERRDLLNKIFTLTGVNKSVQPVPVPTTTRINQNYFRVGARAGVPWATVREQLEKQAANEAWLKRQAEAEQKLTEEVSQMNAGRETQESYLNKGTDPNPKGLELNLGNEDYANN